MSWAAVTCLNSPSPCVINSTLTAAKTTGAMAKDRGSFSMRPLITPAIAYRIVDFWLNVTQILTMVSLSFREPTVLSASNFYEERAQNLTVSSSLPHEMISFHRHKAPFPLTLLWPLD
ncbi:unnamed protein product [Oppiella nova]|uniref:Uncharacterized protein n=1 Tax=Oppiella nova TaxID=334625 RepID=A0A7R9QXY2_9ACAR|nr:unnamed protein product [Oppiella nova]CAG2179767.1 unnamed protein product [Oppiella nova]